MGIFLKLKTEQTKKQTLLKTAVELSPKERRTILLWRRLNEEQQNAMLLVMRDIVF